MWGDKGRTSHEYVHGERAGGDGVEPRVYAWVVEQGTLGGGIFDPDHHSSGDKLCYPECDRKYDDEEAF